MRDQIPYLSDEELQKSEKLEDIFGKNLDDGVFILHVDKIQIYF